MTCKPIDACCACILDQMMIRTRPNEAMMKLSHLYETDETGWLEQMSKLVNERRYKELDYQHLSQYLLDMAKRDRREVLHRLTTLMAHLLKWEHQPRKRSRSWDATILTQRHELQDLLDSRTLDNYAHEILPKAYARATQEAAKETGLAEERFPRDCPYTVEGLLSEE
jgi:hypothetical protein